MMTPQVPTPVSKTVPMSVIFRGKGKLDTVIMAAKEVFKIESWAKAFFKSVLCPIFLPLAVYKIATRSLKIYQKDGSMDSSIQAAIKKVQTVHDRTIFAKESSLADEYKTLCKPLVDEMWTRIQNRGVPFLDRTAFVEMGGVLGELLRKVDQMIPQETKGPQEQKAVMARRVALGYQLYGLVAEAYEREVLAQIAAEYGSPADRGIFAAQIIQQRTDLALEFAHYCCAVFGSEEAPSLDIANVASGQFSLAAAFGMEGMQGMPEVERALNVTEATQTFRKAIEGKTFYPIQIAKEIEREVCEALEKGTAACPEAAESVRLAQEARQFALRLLHELGEGAIRNIQEGLSGEGATLPQNREALEIGVGSILRRPGQHMTAQLDAVVTIVQERMETRANIRQALETAQRDEQIRLGWEQRFLQNIAPLFNDERPRASLVEAETEINRQLDLLRDRAIQRLRQAPIGGSGGFEQLLSAALAVLRDIEARGERDPNLDASQVEIQRLRQRRVQIFLTLRESYRLESGMTTIPEVGEAIDAAEEQGIQEDRKNLLQHLDGAMQKIAFIRDVAFKDVDPAEEGAIEKIEQNLSTGAGEAYRKYCRMRDAWKEAEQAAAAVRMEHYRAEFIAAMEREGREPDLETDAGAPADLGSTTVATGRGFPGDDGAGVHPRQG